MPGSMLRVGIAGLRVGIAGAGHFGRYHALKVAASSRTRLAGIYDPDLERAKTVGWEAGAKVASMMRSRSTLRNGFASLGRPLWSPITS